MTAWRLWRASVYSWAGLQQAWRLQWAFRLECLLTPLVLIAATWLADRGWQWGLLVASWWLVLVVELINSAIETTVDRISADLHPLSKQAKDLGSAAVFVTCMMVMILWVSLLWENKFQSLIG